MKIQVNFDIKMICEKLLKENLDSFGLDYDINELGEIKFHNAPNSIELHKLKLSLAKSGIEVVDDRRFALVQQIKELITDFVYSEYELDRPNLSCYLVEKLNYSYAHLARIFSELTFTSIENFYILKKIDCVKNLIMKENLTLTEVAHRLGYSSVSHLSGQFKKTTGISPSYFQKIIESRL